MSTPATALMMLSESASWSIVYPLLAIYFDFVTFCCWLSMKQLTNHSIYTLGQASPVPKPPVNLCPQASHKVCDMDVNRFHNTGKISCVTPTLTSSKANPYLPAVHFHHAEDLADQSLHWVHWFVVSVWCMLEQEL